MNLICPECYGTLAIGDGKVARCTVHGGEFQILFLRETAQAVTVPPVAAAIAPATDGRAELPIASSPTLPAVAAMRCVQHPSVPATQQCTSCGAYMCATCDFALEGGIHLCPPCATKPRTGLSSKRKKSMIWSYVCAIGATLGFVLTFGGAAMNRGASKLDAQALGVLLMMVVFVPSAVGIGVGLGAIDRRLPNPLSLWIATLWNGLILAVFVLMCVVGSLK